MINHTDKKLVEYLINFTSIALATAATNPET